MDTFKIACYSFASVFILTIGACAPAAKPKSSASPSSSSSAGAKGSGQQRGGATESTLGSQSSLKQLQEGRSTATPASSPLKDVYFEFDRYDLRGDARNALKANAEWLRSNPSARVEIEGHCDDRGTNEYNLALGAKRAQSAKDYLATLGISADRLSTISYGEEIPVCKEQSEDCRQKNRRARFVIIPGRPAS